jgi:hypothetical protein
VGDLALYHMAVTDQVIRLDFGASVNRQPHETTYSLVDLTEDQVRDLASGFVPRVIRAMALGVLDWQDEDERRARRPVPQKRKRHAEV